MSVSNYEELNSHVGHRIAVVTYAGVNVAVECNTCNVVLLDFDAPHDTYPFLVSWFAEDHEGNQVVGETEIHVPGKEAEAIPEDEHEELDEIVRDMFDSLWAKTGIPPLTTAKFLDGTPVPEAELRDWLERSDGVDDLEPLSDAAERVWNRVGMPPLKDYQRRYRY